MILKGKYNQAKVFTETLDPKAKEQIEGLLNEEFTKDSVIRIMPDVHVGAGCVIGTTMTIKDKVVPNLVGVDIGCGLMVTKIAQETVDFQKLDSVIRRNIPSGFNVRKTPHQLLEKTRIDQLNCKSKVDIKRGEVSVGTLGGGNHFIEMNRDENEELYLVIHSGSRNLGLQVALHYQKVAYKNAKRKGIKIDKNLAYLEGKDFNDYLHDMSIMQEYANINRKAMTEIIINEMNLTPKEQFTTIHNYIDLDQMILRKGAVRANKGEKIIIPINMRDGSLICVGKGNKDWNMSAPHGAGRVMSRREARRKVNLHNFRKEMKGIYSTSVSTRTLDEAPEAYKSIDEIIDSIGDAVDILHHIKPVYNFKG